MDTAEGTTAAQPTTAADAAALAGRALRTIRARIGGRAPLVVLGALILAWIVVMGRLIVLRHQRFGSFDFDTGIYDQYLWQAAHGRTANTVRGISFFGHHAQFGLFLMLPFVWLGGGPSTWDVLHTIALASAALPLFLLARDKLGRPWIAVGVGVVWLANPTVQWLVHEGFHPEGMALPFLIGTYLFGERLLAERARDDGAGQVSRRTRWGFILCFALAIIWKEDIALALVGMGLVWVVRRQWHFGLDVIWVAAGWFVLFGVFLVPQIAGGSAFGGVYDLGATPGEVVVNSLKDPTRVIDKLHDNDAAGNAGSLAQPYGFVPVVSPSTLLIGLPQWSTNIVSASPFTFDLRFHYQAVPSAALAISLVEGLRRLLRWRRRLLEVGLVVAVTVALLATRWYGPSPAGHVYDTGFWPLQRTHNHQAKVIGLAYVPSDAGVVGDYRLVPHLTHREVVYTFPNPWKRSNYGVAPGDIGDPTAVTWIVLETGILGDDIELLESIRGSGEFEVRFERDGVVALERVAPPGGGTAPIDVG